MTTRFLSSLRIHKSLCGEFVRLEFDGKIVHVVSISELSKALAEAGDFEAQKVKEEGDTVATLPYPRMSHS